MLTHEEFKARDHFEQEDLLGFAYGRLIEDPPEGFCARLPVPPMLMLDRIANITLRISGLYSKCKLIADCGSPF